MHILVFTPTDYIYEHENDVLKKNKTPEAVYLLKVTNKDTTGTIETCSK